MSAARALSLALALLAATSVAEDLPRLDLGRPVHPSQILGLLERYAARFGEHARVVEIGRSRENRPIHVIEISDPRSGAPRDKAAMYIDGNMHGNETQGTEVCLYTLEFLLENRGSDALVDRVLAERTLLIAPCVNPDGRAHFLDEPNTPHSSRHNLRPTDNDADGLIDEDGYEDLDGDGEILEMRRRVLGGSLTPDTDARLLRRARPQEEAGWEELGGEGIDADGDGRVNEDGPGGVDLNRNFPTLWAPDYEQYGAGPYPLSEPESRAIIEYLLTWPNLAAVQSYHNVGAMILRPPGSSGDGPAGVPGEDRQVYDAIGKLGEELLPGYRYMQTHDDLYRVMGGFLDWGYLGRGIVFFTNELWEYPSDIDRDGKKSPAEALRFSDLVLDGKGWREWRPFVHPQYGDIEIGGWRKLALRIPPAFQMEEMCYRNMRFSLVHADSMPRIEIAEINITSHSDRLHWIDVTVINRGIIPTATAMARKLGVAYPDIVTISGRHVTALGSGLLPPGSNAAVLELHRPEEASLGNLGSRGAATVRFVVEAWKDITITVVSEKGGTVTRTLPIQAGKVR